MSLPSSPSRRILALFSRACGLLLAFVTAAQAATVKFDIPVQPAPAALQAFIKQSGSLVMFSHDELAGVQANAVVGEFDADAALTRLLSGTGFSGRRNGGGKFVVGRERQTAGLGSIEGSVREEKSGKPVSGAKVAIAGTDKFVLTDKRGRFAFEDAPTGDQELLITADGMQTTKVTDVSVKAGYRHTLSAVGIPVQQEGTIKLDTYVVSAKKNDEVVELDPYSVYGQREKPFTTANMDIPRTIDDTQPYYVFDTKTIDRSGAANIEDFLKQRLTMNAVAQTNGQMSGDPGQAGPRGNTSTINLRGLGADKTLILVNGRRMPGIQAQGEVSSSTVEYQPDLNGIPLSAIDRIEVLPSSASGIYGGSAIGGVVNIILKREYSGGEFRATYDNTWNGDSPTRTVSLSYGVALEGGKTQVSFNASWSDAKPMLLQDRRGLLERSVAVIEANSPGYLGSGATPWLGTVPNIAANSSPVLILKNGGSIGSRNTHISAGTSPSTSMTDLSTMLRANAGQWDLGLPPTTQSPTGLLMPIGSTPKTKSLQGSVRRRMLPRLEVFTDISYRENNTESIYNPIVGRLLVPAAAPTSPFTNTASLVIPDAGSVPVSTESSVRSLTVGALVNLPWDWTSAIDYTWTESRFSTLNYSQDSSGLSAALRNGELNPFVDTLLYPLDISKYLNPISFKGSNQLRDFTARASGQLWMLPWGTPSLTVGIEHRLAHTPARFVRIDVPRNTADSTIRKYYEQESATTSGYMEGQLPLLKSDWLPLIHALDLQLSGRSERYSVNAGTSYESTLFNRTPVEIVYGEPLLNGQPYFAEASYTSSNFTIGLKYQPVKEITIRASSASAFLPPMPRQLIKNPLPNPFPDYVIDPRNLDTGLDFGDPAGLYHEVQTISGGNPNLTPQNSKSLNIGIIWEPRWKRLKGLRLNIEYYRIEQFNYIDALSAQQLVNQEDTFSNRITRDSNGMITSVDTSLVNLYHRDTEGWDFSLDYSVETNLGEFSLHTAESIVTALKTQYAQSLPEYDAVNFPADGGAAKYKSSGTLVWKRRGWTAGWATRYVSSYKMYGAAGGPISVQNFDGAAFTSFIKPQGSDTVPSQAYHDLLLSRTFERGESDPRMPLAGLRSAFFTGLTVQLGVRNIFNKAPPLDVFYRSNFFLSPYGDTRLRSYWVSVRKSF